MKIYDWIQIEDNFNIVKHWFLTTKNYMIKDIFSSSVNNLQLIQMTIGDSHYSVIIDINDEIKWSRDLSLTGLKPFILQTIREQKLLTILTT